MRVLRLRAAAATALVAALLVVAVLVQVERARSAAAEAIAPEAATRAAVAVEGWLDGRLARQREALFQLAGTRGAAADPAEALADAVAPLRVSFALWLDEHGDVVAAVPPRAELPAGTSVVGQFPHIDAVLGGERAAVWATEEAATTSGTAFASVVRVAGADDVLSVAFDPAASSMPALARAAVADLSGARVEVVDPTSDAAVVQAVGGDVLGESAGGVRAATIRTSDGLLDVRVAVPSETVAAAAAGPWGPVARGLLGTVALVLLALAGSLAATERRRRAVHATDDAHLFDRSSTPALLVDVDGRVRRGNDALRRRTGHAATGGWDLAALVHAADHDPDVLARAVGAARRGEPFAETRTQRFVGADGSVGDGQLTYVAVGGRDDAVVLVELVDRTADVAAAAQLAESRDQLREYAARVAHDLRNPLTAAQGLASVLATRDLPDDDKRLLADRVAATTQAALETIERLFWSADRLGAEPWQVLELSTLVDRVRPLCGELLEARGGELRVEGGTTGLALPVDTITTVLVNLVDNAVKHHPPGSAPVVTVSAQLEGRRVRLHVTDNGDGVPFEELDAIFRPGTRGVDAGGVGHGSGLADCRRMVEQVGGTVVAGFADAGGLAVTVELPLPVSSATSVQPSPSRGPTADRAPLQRG